MTKYIPEQFQKYVVYVWMANVVWAVMPTLWYWFVRDAEGVREAGERVVGRMLIPWPFRFADAANDVGGVVGLVGSLVLFVYLIRSN